jgi:hypothetical protein
MAINLPDEIALWVGAYLIISAYSWLFKYNRFFKFTEHTLIGAAAGYYLAQGWENVNKIAIGGIRAGNWWNIIPIILGFTLFLRFIPQFAWIQRYGISYIIAGNMIIFIRASIVTQVVQQAAGTIQKVNISTLTNSINSLILVVLFICSIAYFLFSERTSTSVPGYNIINKIGRYGILTALGYYLGLTLMTRIAMVIDRLQFLLFQWLRL